MDNYLTNILPRIILEGYKCKQNVKYNRLLHQTKERNKSNIDRLESLQSHGVGSQDSWFKNVSSTEIPIDVKKFLPLGPKFALYTTVRDVNIPSLLAGVE